MDGSLWIARIRGFYGNTSSERKHIYLWYITDVTNSFVIWYYLSVLDVFKLANCVFWMVEMMVFYDSFVHIV